MKNNITIVTIANYSSFNSNQNSERVWLNYLNSELKEDKFHINKFDIKSFAENLFEYLRNRVDWNSPQDNHLTFIVDKHFNEDEYCRNTFSVSFERFFKYFNLYSQLLD